MTGVNRKALLELTDEFLKQVEDPAIKHHLIVEKSKYQLGLFRIVVVGEINKGKSTFINALLGTRDVIPATSDVTTSTVFKIMYGSEPQARVFWALPEKGTKGEPTVVPLADVGNYGTEDHNPDNEKEVDFIGVQLDNPLLKQGIAIIDTPGLGGMVKKHNGITWRYLPKADAVFFVTDSKEALISADEVEMLKMIQRITPFIFFVQTKADLDDERTCIDWMDRNLEILEEGLDVPGKDLNYFLVSSTLKLAADENQDKDLLEESGFPPLLNFLQHKLIRNKERQNSLKLMKTLATISAADEQKLKAELEIYRASGKKELDALEEKYNATKSKYSEWKSGGYQEVTTKILRRFQTIRLKSRQRLDEKLDEHPDGPIVDPIISRIQSADINAKDIHGKVKTYAKKCADHCLEIVHQVEQDYVTQMNSEVAKVAELLTRSLLLQPEINIDIDPENPTRIDLQSDWFMGIRSVFFGAAAVSGMAGFGLIVVNIVFPVALPVALGAWILGNIIGGVKAKKIYDEEQKKKIVSGVKQLLVRTVSVVKKKAIHQFDLLAQTSQHAVLDNVTRIASDYERDLAEGIKDVERARTSTDSERIAKIETLEEELAQLKNLETELAQLKNLETTLGSLAESPRVTASSDE